ILVDLESHRPIDLLPDRQAETTTAWMRDNPEISVVSRDRASAYASAASEAAPHAVQVADRFQVSKNLTEATQLLLARCQAEIVAAGKGEKPTQNESGQPTISIEEWRPNVNACVILRPNNFDPPPVIFFPKLTRSKILTPSFSHTAVRCGSPTLRQVVSTWTCCGGRLAPRRAHEGYTAEPLRALVSSAQPPTAIQVVRPAAPSCLDSLTPDAHRGGPPPLDSTICCWLMLSLVCQDEWTPTP